MKKKINKKIIAVIIFIAIALVAGNFLKSKKDAVANQDVATKPTISVKLTNTKQSSLTDSKNYLATLQANNSVNISSKLSGYIKKIHLNEGDIVKKGDLLVEIDDFEIKSNIDSVKSSIVAIEKDLEYKNLVYDRNTKLYLKKALSKEKLDLSYVAFVSTKSKLEATQQKIDSLMNQLKYMNIKAPYDGVVSTIITKEGDLAMPNKPIIKLNSEDKKLTFTFIDNKIKKGLDVYVDGSIAGEINTIYNDAKNGLKIAEVKLSRDINRVNGEVVNIDVVFDKIDGCVVDSRAILYDNSKTKLVTYSEDKFDFFEVDIILSQKEKTLITPCTSDSIALASQSKLSILPQYSYVNIIEAEDEKIK